MHRLIKDPTCGVFLRAFRSLSKDLAEVGKNGRFYRETSRS